MVNEINTGWWWLEHMEFDDFPDHIGNGISSSTTDEHIFQRGRYTTNQKMIKQNKNNHIINYIYI